jgi:SRSO17 transposase
MGHVHANIRFIENFLVKFKPIMSNAQFAALRDIIYGSFFDYKRFSLAAVSQKTHSNYQKLQYFFSDSDWSARQLNDMAKC